MIAGRTSDSEHRFGIRAKLGSVMALLGTGVFGTRFLRFGADRPEIQVTAYIQAHKHPNTPESILHDHKAFIYDLA